MSKGMSLVEVMVALSVLAIASIALLSSFRTATVLTDATEQSNAAANAIQEKLTEVRADAFENFETMIDSYTTESAYYNFDIIGSDGTPLRRGARSSYGSVGHVSVTALSSLSGDLTDIPNVTLVRVDVAACWLGPADDIRMNRSLVLARRR